MSGVPPQRHLATTNRAGSLPSEKARKSESHKKGDNKRVLLQAPQLCLSQGQDNTTVLPSRAADTQPFLQKPYLCQLPQCCYRPHTSQQ
jgi:hypothetical protein